MSAYWPLDRYFNRSPDDVPGYDPDALFPKSHLCKIGTQGTIDEDDTFQKYNWFPYLNHFWKPWAPVGGTFNATVYGPDLFDEAVMHFADGREKDAFFDFGRSVHVLEDMGSVPHLFADFHPNVAWINANGFEKWCKNNRPLLQTSSASEPVTSLPSAMETLGLETFRAARISGALERDEAHPVSGDLAGLFPSAEYVWYIPPDAAFGIKEHWCIEGADCYEAGNDPIRNETDRWGPAPGLPGDDHGHFYFQFNQERIVPGNVWNGSAWVPNTGGHSLAQLWAGVPGLGVSRDQAHPLIPRTIEYAAGYLKYLWDFVNPPPHLSRVRIEQDQNGDGAIDPAGDEVICDRTWVALGGPALLDHASRALKEGPSAPAMRLPVRIDLRFSEPVRDVTVALGTDAPSLVLGTGLASDRGPPTAAFPEGEPRVMLPAVDLAGLPDGPITLFVTAQDLSNHVEPVASALDPDPSTRAGRLPSGFWRNIEEDASFPDTDRNHSFRIGGIAVRGTPPFGQCAPGHPVAHAIEVRNLSLPAGTEATIGAFANAAPGWGTNAPALDGTPFALPSPGTAWVPTGASLAVSCSEDAVTGLETFLTASAAATIALTSVFDTAVTAGGTPINDHPDDTQSVTNSRYPTPWPIDTAAPVGVLLNGWGAGIGHLLGRYGIATAPVAPDLRILNGSSAGIESLKVLVVGSGGLTSLDRLPSFREKLARFVDGGGVLIAFTPQRGAELAALPGGQVAGFGWSEDQACFGAAARIAGRDASLAGQTANVIDAGADGYLTRWPDDATVLLERTSNGQPAMIVYPFGSGKVYVATLYPDWGYGAWQSSPMERALVRDLVTAGLAWPTPIPEFLPGDAVALSVPVVNGAWADAAGVSLEPLTPDRSPLAPEVVETPLAQGASAAVPLTLTAPETAGVYPVGYRLLDGGGVARQTSANAAFFAVFGTQETPTPPPEGLRLWVTAPADLVPVGGVAAATVHVRNETAQEYAGAIGVTWVHLGQGPLLWTTGVSVPAGGESTFPVEYPVLFEYPFTLVYGLFPSTATFPPADFQQRAAASAMKGFEPFTRSADVALTGGAPLLRPGVPFPLDVRVATAAPRSFDADVVLRLLSASNGELWTETRTVSLPAAGAATFTATILTTDGEPGFARLLAEVRAGATIVGQGTLLLEQPPLQLTIEPRLPQPWDPAQPSTLEFVVRNGGAFATAAGTLTARIADSRNATLWSAGAELPALAAGAEATVSLSVVVPDLPFGDVRLRYLAEVPGGRFAAARALRNDVRLTLTATPETVGDGDTLALGVSATNAGDFAISGTLGLEATGLLPAAEEPVTLAPGAAIVRDFAAPVTESTPLGSHTVTASLHASDEATVTSRVVVPPARLDYLPPPAEAAAGGLLNVTAVNTAHNTGTFAWSLRLFAVGIDPDDPLAVPLAQAGGTIRLVAAADADLDLAIPEGLATGTYTLSIDARDAVSGLSFPRRDYVFVRGLSASLAVAPGRAVYARAEPVAAMATVSNGGATALAGTSLELSVVGAGVVETVVYGDTVVVSPAGDDALGDGTAERPFATPQRGVDAAPAGARVLLLAGTYPAGVMLRAGTILQGEVVGGEPAAVIADADILGTSGSTVDHVAVRNGNVVYPEDASDVRVSDCRLDGGARTASPRGQGIVFQLSASRVLIGRNRIAGYSAGRAGVQFFGPAADVMIHENSFSSLTGSSNNGVIALDVAERVTVQGNVFSALAGGCNGVHFWGGSVPSRMLAVLGNRFDGMTGGCNGVHTWTPTEAIEVRGNRLSGLSGDAGGIHLWETTVSADLSDNALSGWAGDASGIHLWGGSGGPHRDVRIENNRLADLGTLNDTSGNNGIVLWHATERATVARNVLERVDGDRTWLESGIAVNATASALSIERNVVRESVAGIALRPPAPAPGGHTLEAVTLANNLLAGNDVGFLEENLQAADDVVFRDGIVHSSARAGVLVLGGGPRVAAIHHSDFFANARDVEGGSDPAGADGNLAADPLFADLGGGDLHLLPGSACIDAGSRPTLDIGPLDDDLTVVLGPRPVAMAAGGKVHWSTTLPVAVAPGGTVELPVPVEPLDAAGSLLLVGRVSNAAGQTLAADTARFTVQADRVLLSISASRDAWRPGETIPVAVDVENTGESALQDLLVRVSSGGVELFAQTISLAPGAAAALAFDTSALQDTVLHAAAGLATADLRIRVVQPAATIDVVGPAVAGDEPFPLSALVANAGPVPVDLALDFAGGQDAFTLGPGEQRAFARTATVTRDTVFVASLSGDVTDTVSRLVRYGPSLALRLEAAEWQAAGPASATLVLANAGSLATTAAVSLVLDADGTAAGGPWSREVWLAPGAEVREQIALGTLGPGAYTLRASCRDLAASAPVRIVQASAPRIVGLAVATALDAEGRLPVAIRVRNDGVNPLSAELSLATGFSADSVPVALAAGEEREVAFALTIAEVPPGDYTAVAALTVDGTPAASASAPLALRPTLTLTDVPIDPELTAGAPTEIAIQVGNAGLTRGEARIRLTCGEYHDEEMTIAVGPGATATARFLVTVAADATSDPIPATVTLTDGWSGHLQTRGFIAWPIPALGVGLTASLDRPTYRDGDTARITLKVTNRQGGPAPVRVMVGHAERRESRDIVVTPPPEAVGLATSPWGFVLLDFGQTEGSLTSSALDLVDTANVVVAWDATIPSGCSLALETRTGSTATPDASWTEWAAATSGSVASVRDDRFLQYRALLASPAPDTSPILHEVRILPADPDRNTTHTVWEDFTAAALEVRVDFPVDFAAGDQVFYGLYAESGRALAMNLLPLRRAGTNLSAWTDRDRYYLGETIQLSVETTAAGLLEIATPWGSSVRDLPGPGLVSVPVGIPRFVLSGTYSLVVEFLGESLTVPVEVTGWLVRVMEARLDPASLLPGQDATLTLALQSTKSLDDVAIKGWLSDGRSTREAFARPCALSNGLDIFDLDVPTGALPPGEWTLSITVVGGPGGGVPPLTLAGAEVTFEVLAPNREPVADAGSDLSALERDWVQLNGTASADPDNDALAWNWVQTAGPAVVLHGAFTARPVFATPEVGRDGGRLVFALTVSDGRLTSGADEVEVTVADANRPPVASAGPDLTCHVGEAAALDATGSYDPDGDALVFRWALASRPAGSAASIAGAGSVAAALVPDVPGDYAVALTVGDGLTESAPDTVAVSTVNSRPRADAGEDRTVRPGDLVQLDGGASDDADGDPLTFAWTVVERPDGSAAPLDGAGSEHASLLVDRCGRFVVELVVNDGLLASEPDSVALDCTNSAPVADAGPDRAARLGERVRLDGTASSDVDGDPLSFAWAFTARPAGSAAALDDPAAPSPSFTADRTGSYALTLVVDDGSVASGPDGVGVAVNAGAAGATIGLAPASLRLVAPPISLRARIELPDGFTARNIDPAAAAITAIGKRVLSRPVRRIAARGAVITDVDRDGRPEMNLHFPARPLLPWLRAGTRVALTLRGPLKPWGRFLGSAYLRVAP
ncbi:MAG TPA: PKD domain-containing protein [bacterium]